MLWRRREQKEEALGETEAREKADEASRQRAGSAESIPGCAEIRLTDNRHRSLFVYNAIIKIQKKSFGLGILKKYPEILAETTKVRIQAIVNMLERNGVEKNVITKTPEIVYVNDTKEIENIINKTEINN